MLVEASFHTCVAIEPLKYAGQSVAESRGGGPWGHLPPPPSEALPPPSEEKNGQNQPFSAIFWIFAPSETYFVSSMPPHKNFSGAATVVSEVYSASGDSADRQK